MNTRRYIYAGEMENISAVSTVSIGTVLLLRQLTTMRKAVNDIFFTCLRAIQRARTGHGHLANEKVVFSLAA